MSKVEIYRCDGCGKTQADRDGWSWAMIEVKPFEHGIHMRQDTVNMLKPLPPPQPNGVIRIRIGERRGDSFDVCSAACAASLFGFKP